MFWLQTTSLTFKIIWVFSVKDYDWVPYFFKKKCPIKDSKVHGANMGPTWVLLAPWNLLSGIPMFLSPLMFFLTILFLSQQFSGLLPANQKPCLKTCLKAALSFFCSELYLTIITPHLMWCIMYDSQVDKCLLLLLLIFKFESWKLSIVPFSNFYHIYRSVWRDIATVT